MLCEWEAFEYPKNSLSFLWQNSGDKTKRKKIFKKSIRDKKILDSFF